MAKNGKDWDAIREAWEGGAPWSKLKKMASKGAISNHANGFNGDEPWDAAKRKANGGNGNGKKRKPVNSEQRTVNSEQAEPHAQGGRAAIPVEKRLEYNTMNATLAQQATRAILERVKAIMLNPKATVEMLKAAAQMQAAAAKSATSSNSIIRLNAGLADSKTESDVRGHVEFTPEQVARSASETFGIDLGRTTADPVPVAEDVRN